MKLMQFFGVLALLFIMSLPSFSHASYQQYDGKQASETGCHRDAITANSKTHRGMYYIVRVELRYSPSCGTNWARIYYENKATTHDPKMDEALVPDFVQLSIQRVTGRYAYYSVRNSNTTGVYYTPMIYAKNDTARADLVFDEKGCVGCARGLKKYRVHLRTER